MALFFPKGSVIIPSIFLLRLHTYVHTELSNEYKESDYVYVPMKNVSETETQKALHRVNLVTYFPAAILWPNPS
jgi:hypothetical protein